MNLTTTLLVTFLSVTQNLGQAVNNMTRAVRIDIHPTMLVATAAVLPADHNNNIHVCCPEVNHNKIKPNIVNEVAQRSIRQGSRIKGFQPFGSDMEFFITKTTMVSMVNLRDWIRRGEMS